MPKYNVIMSAPGVYYPDRSDPKNVLTNKDLEKMVQIDTNIEWIDSRTGMCEGLISHYISAKDMALNAFLDSLGKSNTDKNEVDKIKLALNRHDSEITFPQHSGYLAHSIGRPEMPFSDGPFMGCVGYIGVVEEAWNELMNPKSRKEIIAAGATERLSAWTNFYDRATCILFGDAAGYTILKRVPANSGIEGIINIWTSGKYDLDGHLTMKRSKGLRIRPLDYPGDKSRFKYPTDKFKFEEIDQRYLIMPGGKSVLKFATNAMYEAVHKVLENTDYNISDIDVIIPHSANKRITDGAERKLRNIPDEKGRVFKGEIVTCYETFRNTSSTSVPVSENEARKEGRINKGDLIAHVAFGGGLQKGAILSRAV